MNQLEFCILVKQIVENARNLKDLHTTEKNALVNYACIFCQSDNEFESFLELAGKMGEVVKTTPKGPLFKISPIKTAAGPLQILKIRAPDKTRLERGDADFTVADYNVFKASVLGRQFFKLIEKKDFEMIELFDPNSKLNVRAYFSNPTQEELILGKNVR